MRCEYFWSQLRVFLITVQPWGGLHKHRAPMHRAPPAGKVGLIGRGPTISARGKGTMLLLVLTMGRRAILQRIMASFLTECRCTIETQMDWSYMGGSLERVLGTAVKIAL